MHMTSILLLPGEYPPPAYRDIVLLALEKAGKYHNITQDNFQDEGECVDK